MQKFQQEDRTYLTNLVGAYKARYARLLSEGSSTEAIESCQRSIQYYLGEMIAMKRQERRAHNPVVAIRSFAKRVTAFMFLKPQAA